MIIPIDKNALCEYTLAGDEGEFKTVFRLGYFTARQKTAISIASKRTQKELDEPRLWWYEIVRHGLLGWTNFKTADGKELEYKKTRMVLNGFGEFDVLDNSIFDAFQIDWIIELAQKLYDMNYITEEEKKKD